MRKLISILSGLIIYSTLSFSQNLICSEMVHRPENTGITVKAIFDSIVQARVSFGPTSGSYPNHTLWQTFAVDTMGEALAIINITGLTSNTKYFYKLQYRKPGDTITNSRPEHSFYTARTPGNEFTFTVEADPHLDANSDTALYRLCLKNQLEDNPDFMFDLGDFLMSEKLKNANHVVPIDTVPYRCKLLRSFYSSTCHSVPLYNVLGNHEGENGWYQNGTANNIAVWSTNFRKKYFMNPIPDGFYSGDTTNYNYVGQRESYYSWEWGDALFIVLDNYWFTTPKPDSLHCWRWTLGKQQYDWLKATLENSIKPFKFVFAHQIEGNTAEGRGGIERAQYYEWGGLNADSTNGWATNRPGWYKPIKDLLTEHHVNIFFHGHDHLYAQQKLDCMIYQECPQPSLPFFQDPPSQAAEYGYTHGVIRPNAGHIRVHVAPSGVTVDYIRAVLPSQETSSLHNKDIAATYGFGLVDCYDSLQSVNDFISSDGIKAMTFPNPFRDNTTVRIEAAKILHQVSIEITDINGHLIRQLLDAATLTEGTYSVVWDGANSTGTKVGAGVYLCKIQTESSSIYNKITLIK